MDGEDQLPNGPASEAALEALGKKSTNEVKIKSVVTTPKGCDGKKVKSGVGSSNKFGIEKKKKKRKRKICGFFVRISAGSKIG